jgi:hypothetical protein
MWGQGGAVPFPPHLRRVEGPSMPTPRGVNLRCCKGDPEPGVSLGYIWIFQEFIGRLDDGNFCLPQMQPHTTVEINLVRVRVKDRVKG